MKSVPTVIDTLNSSFSDMDSEARTAALSVLFGAESVAGWSAILDRGSDELADYTKELENSEGAASEMAETMQDNAKGAITELRSAAEGAGIALAEHMIPTVTRLVEEGTELIRKFGELDDEQQEQIIKWGLIAAAIGPVTGLLGGVTRVAGGTISTFGRLASSIGTKSDASGGGAGRRASLVGGLGALSLSSGPMALAIAGVGGLTAAGVALHNHMKQDVIPEVDLFGDSVSENTEQAVSSFMDLNNEATSQLNELMWSGREVSEEMAESLTGTFDEMGTQIVEGLRERKDESILAVQELFTESKSITEQEQAEILESVTEGYNQRITTTEESHARIKEILETASSEKRALTREEQQEINKIQKEQKELAIETLSENEQEQQIILERMRDQAEDITARQAADTIKKSIETKEGVIAEAEDQYYNQVKTIEMMRDETGEITAEQADLMIAEAERQRDETIKNAKDMHQNVIDEAKDQNPNLLREINITTGEVLSRWEQLAIDSGIAFAKIYTKASDTWDDIKEVFDDKITIPSPVIDSNPVLRSARSIFNSIRNIFDRRVSVPAPRMRNIERQPRGYAEGTDYSPAGLAFLGEEGPELIRHGNRWGVADFGLYELQRGTQVFTNDETKKILSAMNNIPGYASGISPVGEANRIVDRLNQPMQGQAVIYTTVINQMDGREISRHTYKHDMEFQEQEQIGKMRARGMA